jgi:predicted nucleic acid-binding protein
MIVVDANVLVYWATDSPQTDHVDELRTRDSNWRTVPLWRYEFTNAIAMMVRAKVLSQPKALDALAKADALMTPREYTVPQSDVLRLTNHYNISAYDAQYITLAQLLGVTCVTADARLARKTQGISLLLSDVDQLPLPQ